MQRIAWLAACLIISNSYIYSDTIYLQQKKEKYDINKHAQIFIDSTKILTINDFLRNGNEFKFSNNNTGKTNFGINDYVLWIRFDLKNLDSPVNHWLLEIDYYTLNKVEFFEVRNGNIHQHKFGGMDYISKSEIIARNSVFSMDLSANETATYYIRIETYSFQIVPIKLFSTTKLMKEADNRYFPINMMMGIMLGVFLFNFILFIISKERMYLFFSLGIAMILVNFLSNFGYLNLFDAGLPVYWYTRIRYIGYQLSNVFFLLFTIEYLETRKYYKTGSYIMYFGIVFMIVYLIYYCLPWANLYFLNQIPVIAFPGFALAQLFVGIVVLKKGHRTAIYFIVSYIVFVLSAILYPLFLKAVIEPGLFIKHIYLIGMSIFSILLTAGLTEKIANVKREKIKANLLMAQKENLESLVAERTNELVENQIKYHDLVEQLHDWIWQIDKNGIFTYSSKSVELILGYLPIEIVGKHYTNFFSKEESGALKKMIDSVNFNKKGFINFEIKTQTKTGYPVLIETSGKPYFDVDDKYLGWRGLTRDISNKKLIERKLLKTVLETEEKERKWFASELHDGLGATLSGINMYLNTIDSDDIDDGLKKELLKKVHQLVKHLAAEARTLAHNIRPYEIAYLGLNSSLINLFQKVIIPGKFDANLDFNDLKIVLDKDTELIIFRIISELLNNTLKHAQATSIELTIKATAKRILIRYSDNGIGFDLNKVLDANKGIGIQNIINRVNVLNGLIVFNNKNNIGTLVEIEI